MRAVEARIVLVGADLRTPLGGTGSVPQYAPDSHNACIYRNENARIGVGHHFEVALSSKTVLAPDDRPPMISFARSNRCSQCFARSLFESVGLSSGTNCIIGLPL